MDTDEVEDMVAAPNGDLWRMPEMQERLELHLQESYNAYQDTISHMEEIMKRIAKDFKMDHSERVRKPQAIFLRDQADLFILLPRQIVPT